MPPQAPKATISHVGCLELHASSGWLSWVFIKLISPPETHGSVYVSCAGIGHKRKCTFPAHYLHYTSSIPYFPLRRSLVVQSTIGLVVARASLPLSRAGRTTGLLQRHVMLRNTPRVLQRAGLDVKLARPSNHFTIHELALCTTHPTPFSHILIHELGGSENLLSGSSVMFLP